MGNRSMFVGLDVHKETIDVSSRTRKRSPGWRHCGRFRRWVAWLRVGSMARGSLARLHDRVALDSLMSRWTATSTLPRWFCGQPFGRPFTQGTDIVAGTQS